MRSYEHIEVEIDGGVATLWLNRPEKLNALSEDMWADIPSAMEDLDNDDSVRAVVLAGRGPSFSVGIDVNMLTGFVATEGSRASSNRDLYQLIRRLQRTTSVFAESPKPVIAAVHGHCLGAGMDLITACDIRLAAADSTFGIRETRMGIVADVGTLQRLPAIVGQGHVAELAFTGNDIDAARALEIGLINSTHPDSELTLKSARELAAMIAANSPFVVAGVKQVLAANRGRTVEEALDYVAQWNAAYLLTDDMVEAAAAYLEKRDPDFKGR